MTLASVALSSLCSCFAPPPAVTFVFSLLRVSRGLPSLQVVPLEPLIQSEAQPSARAARSRKCAQAWTSLGQGVCCGVLIPASTVGSSPFWAAGD